MKTQVISANDHIKNLEVEIEQNHNILYEKAIKDARFYGRENKPAPNEPINSYFRPISQSYSLLYQNSINKLTSIQQTTENELDRVKETELQLAGKRATLGKDKNLKTEELDEYKIEYSWGLLPFYIIGLFIILAGETWFNGFAFQIMGSDLFSSLITALASTLTILIIYHLFIKSIALVNGLPLKICISLLWFTALTAFFYFLSEFRIARLEDNGMVNRVSPIMFILCNWFFIIASGWLLYKCPNRKERNDRLQHRRLSREVTTLKSSFDEVETNISSNNLQKVSLERGLKHMTGYNERFEKLLVSMRDKTLADFMAVNVSTRSDGYSRLNTIDPNDFLNTHIKTQTLS